LFSNVIPVNRQAKWDLGRLPRYAGPRVRIRLPPAASLQTLGPSAQQHVSRRVVECRCGGGTYLFGMWIPGEQRGGRSGNPRARTYRYRWHARSPGHPLNGQSFTMLGMRSAPIGRSVYRSDRRFLRTPRGIKINPASGLCVKAVALVPTAGDAAVVCIRGSLWQPLRPYSEGGGFQLSIPPSRSMPQPASEAPQMRARGRRVRYLS
jgi:hypothetical protein